MRCKYFGDFLAVSLVSWIVSMAGLFVSKKVCRHGREMFREAIFQVVRYAAGVMYSLLFIRIAGGCMLGKGGIYPISG